MITSFIPGRVRLRACALRNPETMQTVLGLAQGTEGIVSITPNLKAGSLLIIYDPEVIGEDMLAQAAAAFEEHFGPEEESACFNGLNFECPAWLTGKKSELGLLLGTLGLTVGSLAFGKGAHAALGALFCLLSAKHVYDRRRQMF